MLDNFCSLTYFCCFSKVYMEEDYVRKMSDEVNMEVDMNNDVRIDEDIHKDYE